MDTGLRGKTVWITGASRNIGCYAALALNQTATQSGGLVQCFLGPLFVSLNCKNR
jgi:hypothetical protein